MAASLWNRSLRGSGSWLSLPSPPGFLKAAQFGDKDILFKTFEVGSGNDAPLNIVVSMRTATVHVGRG